MHDLEDLLMKSKINNKLNFMQSFKFTLTAALQSYKV